MTAAPTSELRIEAVLPAQQGTALWLLLQELSPDEREAHVAQMLTAAALSPLSLTGLLGAYRGEALVGVTLLEILPGHVASLWPVQLVPGEVETTAERLLQHALATSRSAGARMVQSLLAVDAPRQAERLAAASLRPIAELLFAASTARSFPRSAPSDELLELRFESLASAPLARLAAVVERTYVGTQDCPALNGLRPVEEVLAGYQAVGVYDPSRWFIVCHAGEDVGCVLISEHPAMNQCELIYMGLIPEVRGRGWGTQLVRHAQRLTAQIGHRQLVLAVDAANTAAWRIYSACGFLICDRRQVMLRVF